jgi:hypothetical protein
MIAHGRLLTLDELETDPYPAYALLQQDLPVVLR